MSANIFQMTMNGLETGLQVLHIATLDGNLRTISIDEERSIKTLFADEQFEGIDQIPVRRNDSIVGVVTSECEGTIKQCMRPLDETMLISAQEPLTQFIPLMEKSPSYRLVLKGGCISGIVTRSDLLKLPVRIFAFTLVAHLELLMAEIIHAKFPDDQNEHEPQWLQHLSETRQKEVNETQEKRKKENIELSLLECTQFCDKRDIVKKICPLPSRNKFKNDLEEIEQHLRNKVAHAANYAHNDQEMEQFIHLVILAQEWIDQLESYLASFTQLSSSDKI